MDGVQLPQGYIHFEEAVYFLSFSSQKFLVLNASLLISMLEKLNLFCLTGLTTLLLKWMTLISIS